MVGKIRKRTQRLTSKLAKNPAAGVEKFGRWDAVVKPTSRSVVIVEGASVVIVEGAKPPSGRPRNKSGVFSFGSVVVKGQKLDNDQYVLNIKWGQSALNRVAKKLIKAGVSVKHTKGVPLFHADPARPDRIIRVIDGKEESGFFEGGKFRSA